MHHILAPRYLLPPDGRAARPAQVPAPGPASSDGQRPPQLEASDLVDDPTQADALAGAWRSAQGDGPPLPGLLLIDPMGGPGSQMVQGLGQAVGQPVRRRRVLSPMGLRSLATVDELSPAIATPGPQVVRCLHVRRLESLTGSLALQSLLSASDLVAVLSGGLSPAEQARWTVGACALIRQHLAAAVEGPRWLLFTRTPPRPWPEGQPLPHWLGRLQLLQQPASSPAATAGVLWNHILAGWMAQARRPLPHLALRPAG